MNIELQLCTESDFNFAFDAKKQAMGPHISVKWGWDEDYQLTIHKQRWNEKPWYLIMLDGAPIGTVSIHNISNDVVRFGEFYILKEFQGQGIGTEVFQSFLAECDQKHQRVKLEYLKWNPVGSLYKRNGFMVVAETDIHYHLEREPYAL